MTKDELKKLGLTDEQVEAITKDYGINYVSKERFNEKNEEVKTLKTAQTQATQELEGLKTKNANNQELQAQITQLQQAQQAREEQHQKELQARDVSRIVGFALRDRKAKNEKAVMALLDLSNPVIKGDSIVGLKEQLDELVAKEAYLFEGDKVSEAPKVSGVKPRETPPQENTGITKEQFSKMGYQDRVKLYNENPDTYKQMVEE